MIVSFIFNFIFLCFPWDIKVNEVETWRGVGKPDRAAGEDLFTLINGGAEIYHEYGFKQTIMQSYENDRGKSINLEIYDMSDPVSAYGIYTFKTSPRGEEKQIGNDALLEDYYLNFWKGNFLVTLTGFDSEQETRNGLMTLARAVEKKIKQKGEKPGLIRLLLKKGLKNNSIKYLKGNLALFNNYDFGSGNIFGLKQGVIGDYSSYRVFVFEYKNRNESEKWFTNARKMITSNARFDVFDQPGSAEYSVFSRDQDRIFMAVYQHYILIIKGSVTTEGGKILTRLKQRIDQQNN